jgi:hypothetical protein
MQNEMSYEKQARRMYPAFREIQSSATYYSSFAVSGNTFQRERSTKKVEC